MSKNFDEDIDFGGDYGVRLEVHLPIPVETRGVPDCVVSSEYNYVATL